MTGITRAMLACVLALATVPALAADDAALAQEARDRAAIEALMWRYVRALDSLDADGYAAAFTADGQFTAGASTEKGTAELKEMVVGLKNDRAAREAKGEPPSPAMYHVIVNHTIELTDKDHARYDAYWMTVFAGAKQGEAARVAAVGRSVDTLVRQNGKWLIQTRNVTPQ